MVLSSKTVVDGANMASSANQNMFDANANLTHMDGMSRLYSININSGSKNFPALNGGGGCGCSENIV
jgi:hypothetical protein